MAGLLDILASNEPIQRTQQPPRALLDLLASGANYMAPNLMSLMRGGQAPPLPNVPEYGKVPPTTDPRQFGAVAEAANIGQNFLPQAGTAKLGGGMLAALIGLPAARKGIRAYHGSPHDFDRFDMSKIGTGEGAQAYGHGLYFAENPAVAESYKGGILPQNAVGNTTKRYLDKFGNVDEAIAYAQSRKAAEQSRDNRQFWDDVVARMRNVSEGGDYGPRGRMYEVNINAAPEQFLDWDRPLAQQPKSVQEMIRSEFSKPTSQPIRKDISLDPTAGTFVPEYSGSQLYRDVIPNQLMPLGRATDPNISAMLRGAGIPGIKYLDQGSRFHPQQVEHLTNQIAQLEAKEQTPDVIRALAGRRQELAALQPTSNYVLFRDDIIDILRKYGLAGIPAAGAVGATLNNE